MKKNLRKGTKTVYFNACCIATYPGKLDVPADLSRKEVLSYILDHLNDVPCEGLEYIGDTEEPVTEEDIRNLDDFEENQMSEKLTYQLNLQGKEKVERFLSGLEKIRAEYLRNGDTTEETQLPTVEDIVSDLNCFGIDDEGCYYNAWGVTDQRNSDTLSLEYGKDFTEYKADDPAESSFEKTDDLQWRAESPEGFILVEVRELPDGYTAVRGFVSRDEIHDCEDSLLQSYGYKDAEDVRKQYGDDADGIIAECIFETTSISDLTDITAEKVKETTEEAVLLAEELIREI